MSGNPEFNIFKWGDGTWRFAEPPAFIEMRKCTLLEQFVMLPEKDRIVGPDGTEYRIELSSMGDMRAVSDTGISRGLYCSDIRRA